MARIHNIGFQERTLELSVNLFLDYFYFVADRVGRLDQFDLETQMSLVEKILFQAKFNDKRPELYIQNYFSHGAFLDQRFFLKNHGTWKKILSLKVHLDELKKAERKKFVQSAEFIISFENFLNLLNKSFFRNSVKQVFRVLSSGRMDSQSKNELFFHTEILVYSLLLKKKTKDILYAIPNRLFTLNIDEFPFREGLTSNNGKNISFKKRIQALNTIHSEHRNYLWFIFRIFKVKADEDFRYRFNQVTFSHPNSPKFAHIRKELESKKFGKDFFNDGFYLLAHLKIRYTDSREAHKKTVKDVVKIIESELRFFNLALETRGDLDIDSYLTTRDFKSVGGMISMSAGNYIRKWQIPKLKDTPFIFLKKSSAIAKHFLEYEPFFLECINSGRVDQYWQYLENLLHNNRDSKSNNRIVDLVSTILLLNADLNEFYLESYIVDSVMYVEKGEILSISKKELEKFYEAGRTKKGIDLDGLRKKINHPLLNYLLELHGNPLFSKNYSGLKSSYTHILSDAQAQRNFNIHKGTADPLSEVSLDFLLPRLITRFRWVIFSQYQKHEKLSFSQYIEELSDQGKMLLERSG
jgi:hypothetical protein